MCRRNRHTFCVVCPPFTLPLDDAHAVCFAIAAPPTAAQGDPEAPLEPRVRRRQVSADALAAKEAVGARRGGQDERRRRGTQHQLRPRPREAKVARRQRQACRAAQCGQQQRRRARLVRDAQLAHLQQRRDAYGVGCRLRPPGQRRPARRQRRHVAAETAAPAMLGHAGRGRHVAVAAPLYRALGPLDEQRLAPAVPLERVGAVLLGRRVRRRRRRRREWPAANTPGWVGRAKQVGMPRDEQQQRARVGAEGARHERHVAVLPVGEVVAREVGAGFASQPTQHTHGPKRAQGTHPLHSVVPSCP